MTDNDRNLIKALSAAICALQDGYEDEDLWGEASDALDEVNRFLHVEGIDPDVAALATNILEMGWAMND